MDLPSFLWLWKIAAWSMGFAIVAFLIQAITGSGFLVSATPPSWFRPLHWISGVAMGVLVLILLAIGLVGTIGHYGSLGHSSHLFAGLGVVQLFFLSAWSAVQIRSRPWARSLHLTINAILFIALVWVSWTGWLVVQKYL